MPYLSRIWLNPLRTGAQRLLRNPQAMHAAALGGLSRQPVAERVLWRLEAEGAHRARAYVLTDSLPSWEHLVEQAGWPAADEPQALVRPMKPLLAQIVLGREFAFRLKANPVSSTRSPESPSPTQQARLAASDRTRGVRVAHRTAAQQTDWLVSRVRRWGFDLLHGAGGEPALHVAARERMTFTKNGLSGSHHVVLQTAMFEGLVRVVDPDTAQGALLRGVGPGKAYGCGLITLAPPHPLGEA
jgi:CRISPR system Cascade subunit CasE